MFTIRPRSETMASTEDAGILDSAKLAAAGVSEPAIALLKTQQVNHILHVDEMGQSEWAHLYSSGLTLGDRRALAAMLKVFKERPLPLPPLPSLPFNLGSIALGIVFAAPSVALGLINEFGPYDSTRALTLMESLLTVLLPGGVYLVINVAVIETYRTTFSTDVLEQRSVGVSIRDAERSMLTNMAVVAALLLTVIIAMMQSELPGDEPRALLSQWYQIFLYAAMVPCFAAVVLSSMLLLYLEPLDEVASVSFVGVRPPALQHTCDPVPPATLSPHPLTATVPLRHSSISLESPRSP